MGHALVALALPGTDPVHKVSIIPRGIGALGYTIQRPTEDRYLMTREELENKMAVLLGGRAAETSSSATSRPAPPTTSPRPPTSRAAWSRATAWTRSSGNLPFEDEPQPSCRRRWRAPRAPLQRGDRARDRSRGARDRRRRRSTAPWESSPRTATCSRKAHGSSCSTRRSPRPISQCSRNRFGGLQPPDGSTPTAGGADRTLPRRAV